MKKAFIKILFVLFVFIFVCSFSMVIFEIDSENSNIKDFEELASLVVQPQSSVVSSDVQNSSSQNSSSDGQSSDPIQHIGSSIKRDLTPLFQMNKDFVAWLYIPNTSINYPVMYTPDSPNKYLRKNFYGKKSTAGVPYINELCNLNSDNVIIYGHNMRSGTMFTDLAKFMNEDYFETHSYFEFQTAKGVEYYDIFAVAEIKGTDIWYTFANAGNEDAFNYMISYIRSKATIKTDMIPQYGDKLITLSTCTTPSNETDRIVVIAKKLDI